MIFFDFFKKKTAFRIIGNGLTLKPLKKKELKIIKIWFKDNELIRYAFGISATNFSLEKMANDYLKNIFCTSKEILGIWSQDLEFIGFINYATRKALFKTARIGILIGEEKFRSLGLGSKALRLVLLYLFDRAGLEIIDLDTALFNSRAQRCFEKCGFKKKEIITEWNPYSEEFVEKIIMELHREDFLKEIHLRFEKMPIFEGRLPKSKYLSCLKNGKTSID